MALSQEEPITPVEAEQPKSGAIQSTSRSQADSGDNSGTGNLEKVKDLLFGPQMRDYEKRFARLEDRVVKECNNLRDETRKRLDSLESYFQREVDSLAQGLKSEQNRRDESTRNLAKELKDTIKSLERRLIDLDEQTNQKQREVRQQILDQSKSLDDDLRQRHAEILSILEREVQELRTDKTDRSTLASLFAEVAMHLNGEVDLSE